MSRFVLASGSPRRRALLAGLGMHFDVRTSAAEEVDLGHSPAFIVEQNALRKRDAVASLEPDAVVIAADTLVFLGDHVLSKPVSHDDARRMLRQLSGATHEVFTGVAVIDTATGAAAVGHERTGVRFRELGDAEIEVFIAAVNPLDRAGAYTCEGPGSLLIAGFDGCYNNVLGLPIVRLDRLLREIGYDLSSQVDPARAQFL